MSEKIETIQALRGVAASAVVLWHLTVFTGPYGTGLGGALFGSAGAMAVDLFFVLSGFIMVFTTSRAKTSVSEFFLKRFARIWPTYFLATFALTLVDTSSFDTIHFIKSILFVPQDITNIPSFGWPVLNVGWTLNYEMYFYLVFAISIFFGRWRWIALALWFAITLVTIPSVYGHPLSMSAISGLSTAPLPLSFVANPIIWLFAGGVVVGRVYLWAKIYTKPSYARIAFFAACAVAVYQYVFQIHVGHGLFEAGITAPAVVLFGALAAPRVSTPKWLVNLGRISYSLYLTHPVVLAIYFQFVLRSGIVDPFGGWAHLGATFLLSYLVAFGVNRLVEEPIAAMLRSKHPSIAQAHNASA